MGPVRFRTPDRSLHVKKTVIILETKKLRYVFNEKYYNCFVFEDLTGILKPVRSDKVYGMFRHTFSKETKCTYSETLINYIKKRASHY